MAGPCFVIRLGLEERPLILCDFLNEEEELRVVDWISAHPAYGELIVRALELQNETEAA